MAICLNSTLWHVIEVSRVTSGKCPKRQGVCLPSFFLSFLKAKMPSDWMAETGAAIFSYKVEAMC